MKTIFAICLALITCPVLLAGQSRPSAFRSAASLQAGAEVSQFNPDFYCSGTSPFSCGGDGRNLLKGVGVVVDYNVGSRLGAEGEGRWLHWDGTAGQTENTYLIGPRFRFYSWHSLDLWGKFLIGRGTVTLPAFPAASKGSLLVYAPGFSLDYRLTHKISVRGDYEFQKWPGFTSGLAAHNNGLSPNGISIGVSYRIFGR